MRGPARVLAFIAILTVAPSLSAYAYAQYGGGYHRDRGYGRAASPAYDIGYREGAEHGLRDARSGRDFALGHDRDYQRADKGWNWRYGDREAYRYEFRRGYERGYREAYSRSDRYGRDGRCAITVTTEPGTGVVAAAQGTLQAATAEEQAQGLAFWVVTPAGDRIGYSGLASYAPGIADAVPVVAGQALGAATRATTIAWERGGHRINIHPLLQATRPSDA